ncbi:MAG: LysR substrate-binding domain-containing protein [Porticoccaceae bacterium]
MIELVSAVDNLEKFRDTPAGNVKIVTCRLGAHLYVERIIGEFTQKYPDITLEISTNDEAPDLITHGFDAAIREEGMIDMDFIALKLPEICGLGLVASPDYVKQYGLPRTVADLEQHRCINVRRFGHGHPKTWELANDDQHASVNLIKTLIVNDHELAVAAAVQGAGVGLVPETYVTGHIDRGLLMSVLPGWKVRLPKFRLCYPKLKHKTVAFSIFSDFICS